MKLAVMQPYIFPYIGYFQLMEAADEFVLYDNVQFKKQGWIHRNRILVNRQDKMFTLPLKKDSWQTLINERVLSEQWWQRNRRKLLMQIEQNYCKAPCFEQAFPLVSDCLNCSSQNLFDFSRYSLCKVKDYLHISGELKIASSIDVNHDLKGEEKVLRICQERQVDTYINAIGGMELYQREAFESAGVKLVFLKSADIAYPQFRNDFIPSLSIIDVMMFNSVERIREYLGMYELV